MEILVVSKLNVVLKLIQRVLQSHGRHWGIVEELTIVVKKKDY